MGTPPLPRPETNGAFCFFSVPLSRWERIKQRFSWAYIRQTRLLLLPLTEWWLDRGGDAS